MSMAFTRRRAERRRRVRGARPARATGRLPPMRVPRRASRPRKHRVKKLRLLVILVPLALLAGVSTVFGMMMAVASDLPALENEPEYKTAADSRNSNLVDVNGLQIGRLVSDQNR